MAARVADSDSALLIFTMPLDVDGKVIPDLNRGRLALVDSKGLIQRWVCTTSIETRQSSNGWNQTGGVIPPTSSMPGLEHWTVNTKLLVQPGQPVDEGFLVLYRGSTSYTTTEGTTRSEIMIHNDKNRSSSPGSLGCIVTMNDNDWADLKRVMKESVGHLDSIPLFVIYTW